MKFLKNVSIMTILMLSLLIIMQTPVDAAVLTVGPDDADYSSIQDAINNAHFGDTIIVESGTYAENINVSIDNIKIISESGNPNDTVIQPISASDDVFYVNANNVSIEGFRVTGATNPNQAGFYLNNTMHCFILNNTISGNDYGICIYNSSKNTLSYNNVLNNINGINIESHSNNTTLIMNDIFYNNNYGINILYSHNNTLIKNNVSYNYDNGIYAYYSNNNVLTSNMLSNNARYGIHMEYMCNYNELTGNKALSNNRHGICLGTSSYNNIKNNTALNNYIGLAIYAHSGNNTLIDNTVSNNVHEGISYISSSNGMLINNSISNNNGKGISLTDGISNRLLNNEIINNNGNGVFISSSTNTTLNSNNLSGNSYGGVTFTYSNNNELYNSIISNNIFGIGFDSSHNNKIYNNYIENQDNLYFYKTSIGNVWNVSKSAGTNIVGGSYIGGNYWATPSNTGFSQINEDVDGDGICDATYVIDEANVDYLPLSLNETNSSNESDEKSDYGYLIWNENAEQSTTYSWDAKSFSGFFYDLDSGLSSESMTIYNIDRSLGEGNIVYETRPVETDFEHSAWGKYQVIGFMAENYFTAYTANATIDGIEKVSMLSSGQLSKILIDDDEKKYVNESFFLELEEGYSLNIVEVDKNDEKVFVVLSKDNVNLDSAIVSNGDDYVYKVDLGDVDDVATVAVHFNETFTDNEFNGVIIEGLFQISDSYLELNAGDVCGNMELTAISSNLIEMENNFTLLLTKGSTINLMDNINLVVADNNDLRFAPSVNMSENETYEMRGTVAEGTKLLTWTPLNFEGFYYDIDEGIQTETLELISLSGRTIDDGDLVYTSTPVYVDFEHSDWGQFQIIGFLAEKYFAGYTGDTDIDGLDDVNLLSQGHLSKLLINDDNSFLLYSGSSIIFEEQYRLDVTEINESTCEMLVTLTKDEEEIDSRIVSCSSDYVYSHDIGNDTNVTLIAVHFKDIIVAGGKKGVFIEGLFQISDQHMSFAAGDICEKMEITSFSENSIVMKNEDSISLSKGATINVTNNINFRVADDSTIRYYPCVIEGTSLSDDELIIPEEEEESDADSSTTSTSSSSGGGGGGGGGATGEKYENIAYKDVLSEFVSKGDVTSYEFDDERNSIEYISFQAFRNWGKISSTIEMLHNRSALVDIDAPDTIYCNVNLWVGKSAFSSSENIENSVVGFKVEKEWIEENNVDVDTIRLCRYSEDEWSYLDTRKISEDAKYLHFEASTAGFSPFAIVGHSVEKVTTGEVEILKTTDSVESDIDEKKYVTSKPKSTFNSWMVIGLLSILLIGGVAGYVVYRKRS